MGTREPTALGARRQPPPTFSRERLQQVADMEGWHFWFRGRRQLVDRLLERSGLRGGSLVVDVGSGTGWNSRNLHERGYRVVGLDRRPEGLGASDPSYKGPWFVQGDAVALPFGSGSCDAVLAIDTLEHVDDSRVLAEVFRILRPGGTMLLTVPAMPWLWSYRDDAAGHLRRYTRSSLSRVLRERGLSVVDMRYYQFLLFPLLLATRALGRRNARTRDLEDRPAWWVNGPLLWVNRLDVRLGEVLSWPWGSSIVALCERATHEASV
ncbi:class I SAM-dependent methyltransferase [Planctomycetota bacterium]